MTFTGPAYPVLYYRTAATKWSVVADVTALIASYPSQCILFDGNGAMIESVKRTFQKATVDDPQFNADGINQINKQPNGMNPEGLLLTLLFDATTSGQAKAAQLDAFSYLLDVETAYHKWGIFGFWYPKWPNFNFDPINEASQTSPAWPSITPPNYKGYTWVNNDEFHTGKVPVLQPVSVKLSFGGRRP